MRYSTVLALLAAFVLPGAMAGQNDCGNPNVQLKRGFESFEEACNVRAARSTRADEQRFDQSCSAFGGRTEQCGECHNSNTGTAICTCVDHVELALTVSSGCSRDYHPDDCTHEVIQNRNSPFDFM